MDPVIQFRDSFLAETNKLLDEFGAILLANESEKALGTSDINELFRITHTIKGSAGMMGLNGLSTLAHALEELFVLLKRGDGLAAEQAGTLFDLLFEALDALRGDVGDFAQDGAERRSFPELIRKTEAFRDANARSVTLRVTLTADCAMESVRAYLIVASIRSVCPGLSHAPEGLDTDSNASAKVRGEGLYLRFPAVYEDIVRQTLAKDAFVDKVEAADALPNANVGTEREPVQSAAQPEQAAGAEAARENATTENYVFVHLSKLAELQNLTSELILAQNKLLGERALVDPEAIRLERTAERLRGMVVSMRMTAVSGLFQKLHRAVREAGRKLNRDMEFVMAGENVEIDKGVLEALSEALIQIVRNAAVHGVESTRERMNAGKPLMGKITVTARNAGTNVILSIADDGRGISAKKAVDAAVKVGQEPPAMPDSQQALLELLMRPGVTTSEQADEMSGRGIGLDVVRTVVEKLRGSIELETEEGVGTTFTLRIPQSLAVMDCVVLEAGGSVFLLPAPDLYALVQPRAEDLSQYPDGRRLLRYQSYALPALDLGEYFRVRQEPADMGAGVIAVIDGEKNAIAIHADRLLGLQRAEIKPLPALLEALGMRGHGISGCTILPEGSLGLILDANALLALKGEMCR